MSVKMRFTQNNKIFIAGELKEGNDKIELKETGDLHINEFINNITGFDTADEVEVEGRLIQTATEINFEYAHEFLSWFFGIQSKNLDVNFIRMEQGKLLANEIFEQQELGGR